MFSSKAAADSNTITNFTVANDKLSFAKAAFDGLGTLGTSGALTEVTSTETVSSAATAIYKGTLANLANLQGGSSTVNKVVVAVATDEGNEGIYAVTLKNGSNADSIVKVGTLDGVDLGTLTMANFAAA